MLLDLRNGSVSWVELDRTWICVIKEGIILFFLGRFYKTHRSINLGWNKDKHFFLHSVLFSLHLDFRVEWCDETWSVGINVSDCPRDEY